MALHRVDPGDLSSISYHLLPAKSSLCRPLTMHASLACTPLVMLPFLPLASGGVHFSLENPSDTFSRSLPRYLQVKPPCVLTALENQQLENISGIEPLDSIAWKVILANVDLIFPHCLEFLQQMKQICISYPLQARC